MSRAGDFYWKVRSQLITARYFGAFGKRTWIRRPMVIVNAHRMFFGSGCFIRDGARIQVINRPGLPPGQLTLGNGVTVEQDAHIVACDEVILEDQVCIGPRCTIIEPSHSAGTPETGSRVEHVSDKRSFIRIKRRAFLGANVVVLPNVTIGENAIIGANSVVTRDIPDNAVAVGSPARVIRQLD